MVAAVAMRMKETEHIPTTTAEPKVIDLSTEQEPLSVTEERDKALQTTVEESPVDGLKSIVKGASHRVLTWHVRSAAACLFLHRKIYGQGDVITRVGKVATVLAISSATVLESGSV